MTWWKNNNERKIKNVRLQKDSLYSGSDKTKSQRALFCKLALTISNNIKAYNERHSKSNLKEIVQQEPLPISLPSSISTRAPILYQKLVNPKKNTLSRGQSSNTIATSFSRASSDLDSDSEEDDVAIISIPKKRNPYIVQGKKSNSNFAEKSNFNLIPSKSSAFTAFERESLFGTTELDTSYNKSELKSIANKFLDTIEIELEIDSNANKFQPIADFEPIQFPCINVLLEDFYVNDEDFDIEIAKYFDSSDNRNTEMEVDRCSSPTTILQNLHDHDHIISVFLRKNE